MSSSLVSDAVKREVRVRAASASIALTAASVSAALVSGDERNAEAVLLTGADGTISVTAAFCTDTVSMGSAAAPMAVTASVMKGGHTAVEKKKPRLAEQIVKELACGGGGRVHGAKCLAALAGVA